MSNPKLYKLPYTKFDLYYAPQTKELYIKFSTGRVEKIQRNTKRFNYKDIIQKAQAYYKQRQQILSQIKHSIKTTLQKEIINETYSALSSFFENIEEIENQQGVFELVTDNTLVVPVDNKKQYDLRELNVDYIRLYYKVTFSFIHPNDNDKKDTHTINVSILFKPGDDPEGAKCQKEALIKEAIYNDDKISKALQSYEIVLDKYIQINVMKENGHDYVYIEANSERALYFKQVCPSGRSLKTGYYRSAFLNDDDTHVYDDLSDYNFVFFQNLMTTEKQQCYAPIQTDLETLCGVQLKDNENTPKHLMDYIHKYNDKLNYYVAGSDLMIPTASKYRREILISNQWSHIFISQAGKSLFIDIKNLNKNRQVEYYDINDPYEFQRIIKEQLKRKVVPVIINDNIYTDTKVYKTKGSIELDYFKKMFKPDNFSLSNYAYHEIQYKDLSYIHDEDKYITLDVTRFYTNMLINTKFYDYKEIELFNKHQCIRPANLYYLECPLNEDFESFLPEKEYDKKYQILYQYIHAINYMSGELINYFMRNYNINLMPYIKFTLIAKDQYSLSNDQKQLILKLNKKTINSMIGCLNYSQKDQVVQIPYLQYIKEPHNEEPERLKEEVSVQTYNLSQKSFVSYKLIHCQMMNYRFLWQLKHMPQFEDIVQIKTDSITFKRDKGQIDKLIKSGYHEEKYNELQKRNIYCANNLFRDKTLINAFPGSGKTTFIKKQLELFRKCKDKAEFNLNKDDKCLVLVCKLNCVDQYKDFRDVADVRCYQFIDFMQNYQFVNKYKHIYIDEAYMVEAKIIYSLILLNNQNVTFVGDKYQQCNKDYQLHDYDILSLCQNKKELTRNYRNLIDYKQFLYVDDKEFNKFIQELYHLENSQQDSMLLFEHMKHKEIVEQYLKRHPECQDKTKLSRARLLDFIYSSSYFRGPQGHFRGNDNDTEVINICISNQEAFELNYEYKGNNVIKKSNTQKQKPVRLSDISKDKDFFIIESNSGGVIKTKAGKRIDCYYGNSYTVYQIQGLEFEKVRIISPEKMNVNQLFVAISRVKTQEQSKRCPYEHKIEKEQLKDIKTYKDLQDYFFKHKWSAHLLCQYVSQNKAEKPNFVIKYDFNNEYTQLYNTQFTIELSQKEQELLKQSGLNFCFINICNINRRLQTLNAPQTQLKSFCAHKELDLIIMSCVQDQSDIYNSYFEPIQQTLKEYKNKVKNNEIIIKSKSALSQICQKYLDKKKNICSNKVEVSDDE